MTKYAIWNKKDNILTPIGEVLSAEKWIERYPMAGLDNVTVICAAGEINGAFFGTLGQMVDMYTKKGCDFSACETAQEKIDAINAFNEAQALAAEKARIAAIEAEVEASEEQARLIERQTAALEAIASGQTTENAAAIDALLNGEG